MLHELAEGLVDHAVAGDDRLAGELRRHDRQPPVGAATFPVAGMAAMLLAVVDQLQRKRLQRLQPLADAPGDAQCLSSTCRARNSAWISTKPNISPMPPNSLKLTHRSVE